MSQETNVRTDRLEQFAFGWPVMFSILVILAAGLLTEIPLDTVLEPLVGNPVAEFWKVLIEHTLTGLILVRLLHKLGLFKRAGFTPLGQWKAVWLVWPLLVFALLNLDSLIDGSLVIDWSRPGLIALYMCMNLAIGFCEEVMGRGVVLLAMLGKWGRTRRGIYRAVIVSGLLFGIGHIFNLLTGRLTPLASLTQIGFSVFFGVAFAACFLRNNAIWPVVIVHALIDIAGGLRHIAVGGAAQAAVANNTAIQAVTALLITLPLFLYGLFILRKVSPPKRQDATGSASRNPLAST
ncbi:MAG: CPBP family intramembrane metalloprotease [Anaerolineae bacterium]|nr:CPBP family intramembrane metalloprotease [Anaerolineae bacterium]